MSNAAPEASGQGITNIAEQIADKLMATGSNLAPKLAERIGDIAERVAAKLAEGSSQMAQQTLGDVDKIAELVAAKLSQNTGAAAAQKARASSPGASRAATTFSTVPLNWKEVYYTNCPLVSASNIDQELGWTKEWFKKIGAGNGWQFDSEEGKEEVLARRIGGDELEAISLCRDYVGMQEEYASQPHDGKRAGLFAQRFRSSPGRQDGLYWHRKFGERPGPLGDLVVEATVEGYDLNKPESSPFRGYRFRILTAQGPAAPGGKKSYVVNGDMTGGFALLAYPTKYAFSGVMTFVVGQDGIVYQKDLGKDTATQAPQLAEYDPDESRTAVRAP